jgi:hypothetical protein
MILIIFAERNINIMDWIKETIDKWFSEYTVPYDTCPDRHRLEAYTNEEFRKSRDNDPEKIENSFNELTKCVFLVRNGERRILLKDPMQRYDFSFLDSQYWYNFNDLIERLLKTEYKEDDEMDYTRRDYITVSISSSQEVLDYFNISYDFASYAKERDFLQEDSDADRFCFFGDGCYTNAESNYHNSSLFEELDKKLREYFRYEVAPYKKYNPDFDQYRESIRIMDFAEMVDALSFEQIKSVLTEKYWGDEHTTLASKRGLDTGKLDCLENMDKNTLKNMLELLLNSEGKKSFLYGARVLYNI